MRMGKSSNGCWRFGCCWEGGGVSGIPVLREDPAASALTRRCMLTATQIIRAANRSSRGVPIVSEATAKMGLTLLRIRTASITTCKCRFDEELKPHKAKEAVEK